MNALLDLEAPEPQGEASDPKARSARLLELIDVIERCTLEPTRRVFVNRNLRMSSVEEVGFDMDYSVLRYKKRNMEELSFELTAQRLVERRGYPRQILDIPYDPGFAVRGIVVDKRLGNIVKMDEHDHVGRVYHGRRRLSKADRHSIYRQLKIPLMSKDFHVIDTLFALPEAALYADVVDLFELRLGRKEIDYAQLFEDIRSSIDEVHRDGTLKQVVTANLDRYIELDEDLPAALHRLRSANKKLFLLTNSHWDYTRVVMSYALDGRFPEYPSWENYFDLVIVGAQKPAFFKESRPFFEVDRETGGLLDRPVEKLERRRIYQGGCLAEFQRLRSMDGDRVLYVGDHIYGDIIRAKKDTLWRTALILDELEGEQILARSVRHAQSELVELEERIEHLGEETQDLRLKLAALEHAIDDDPNRPETEISELTRIRRNLRQSLDRKKRLTRTLLERKNALSIEVDRCFNPYWGSLFKEGSENSSFGSQVEEYACIYTSRVSNFRFYSPSHYFEAPRHWMAHEKL
ncbi:MAG: HAD-IG family 5'-nucleotidase [Deltaproteobacteria bacterium]|nr:HAD-IG family 5'-nucleotidase [Deltaproteobacteria bacterium]